MEVLLDLEGLQVPLLFSALRALDMSFLYHLSLPSPDLIRQLAKSLQVLTVTLPQPGHHA